jgi:hypothetical protein
MDFQQMHSTERSGTAEMLVMVTWAGREQDEALNSKRLRMKTAFGAAGTTTTTSTVVP